MTNQELASRLYRLTAEHSDERIEMWRHTLHAAAARLDSSWTVPSDRAARDAVLEEAAAHFDKYHEGNEWFSPAIADELRALKKAEAPGKGAEASSPDSARQGTPTSAVGNAPVASAPCVVGTLTDEQIMSAACNAADGLDATRVSEMKAGGWHATTIFDGDTGLLRFGRLIEKAMRATPNRTQDVTNWPADYDSCPNCYGSFSFNRPRQMTDHNCPYCNFNPHRTPERN